MIKYLASLAFAMFCVLAAPTAKAALLFEATLTGASEVPPNGTPATGSMTLLLDEVTNMATITLIFSDLTAPTTGAHIHNAPAGVNGPIILPLIIPLGVTSGVVGPADYVFPVANLDELVSAGLYVNIHTAAFPGGEIRGQIFAATAVNAPHTFAIFALGLLLAAGMMQMRRRKDL